MSTAKRHGEELGGCWRQNEKKYYYYCLSLTPIVATEEAIQQWRLLLFRAEENKRVEKGHFLQCYSQSKNKLIEWQEAEVYEDLSNPTN